MVSMNQVTRREFMDRSGKDVVSCKDEAKALEK